MKIFFLICLWFGAQSLWAQTEYRRYQKNFPPPSILDAKDLNRLLFSELQDQSDDLKRVKYYLLNGETRLAEVHLNKLAFNRTKLRPVVYRYLAILSFIEGRFQKSYDYVSMNELQEMPHYPKICVLKILNQVVLNKTDLLENEWIHCTRGNFKNLKQDNLVWLETLVRMKQSPQPGAALKPFKGTKLAALQNDQLKIYLKLALYLNQEKYLEHQINQLDPEQLVDEEVRELVGHLYYRLGSLAKSYKFIEDLTSPNAENIKGNLYILRKKYELAYAQFKLALEKKQNSQNAMERILPLAWLLGDWAEGTKYAHRVIASPQTQINKLTLAAAFHVQKGEYDKARDLIASISERSRRGSELDVTQLHSFVGLMQNQPTVVRREASASCDMYDLVNCWLRMQLDQWDSFTLTIRRGDNIPVKREWEKLSQNEINQPLQETVYINQLDIEELDDKLIKLIPNAP